MLDSTSPDVVEWLQFIAILTSVHFVATLLRNIRTASRLVPIRSVSPAIVESYNTIPLTFVGSDSRITQSILRFYGRVWIRRKAIKQPFLCDEILIVAQDGTRCAWDRPVVAGDRIRVVLGIGESESHVYRSGRRSSNASELQLVMVFPDESGENFQDCVRSVHVTASGRPVADVGGVLLDREFEWLVIEPAALSADVDRELPWNEVPPSAVWLFCRHPYDENVCRLGEIDDADTQGLKLLYAYGSSRRSGLFALILTSVVRYLVFLTVAVFSIDPSAPRPLQFAAALVLMVWLLRIYRSTFLSRFKIKPPKLKSPEGLLGDFGLSFVDTSIAWHGSTKRSLAVGDRVRRAELWRQLHYEYWEPSVARLRGLLFRLRLLGEALFDGAVSNR